MLSSRFCRREPQLTRTAAFLMDEKDIALDEAQEIIRLLIEDKLKTVEKHIYTGERIANWWKKYGRGPLELPTRKDYE